MATDLVTLVLFLCVNLFDLAAVELELFHPLTQRVRLGCLGLHQDVLKAAPVNDLAPVAWLVGW
jgi:hypothetical protein